MAVEANCWLRFHNLQDVKFKIGLIMKKKEPWRSSRLEFDYKKDLLRTSEDRRSTTIYQEPGSDNFTGAWRRDITQLSFCFLYKLLF